MTDGRRNKALKNWSSCVNPSWLNGH